MRVKKRRYWLFFLCVGILSNHLCFGQNIHEQDSLKNIIHTAPDDTGKVNALVSLAMELVQYQIKDAEKYANQAIELSQKINFPKAEAKAHLVLSRISRETSNYSEALTQTYTALKKFESINNKSGSAKCYYELGYIYKDITDYHKALENFSLALKLYKLEGNETNMAFCQTLMGHVNADLLSSLKDSVYFKKSLGYYTEVLNYYLRQNKRERVAVALLNLSNLYLVYNRIWPSEIHLNKSLDCSQKSLSITRASNDVLRTGINLENIGEVYFVRKKYKEALDYYFQSKKQLDESGNQDYILENLFSIIKIYKEIGDYKKALELSKEYYGIAMQLNYKTSLRDYYQVLSEIYFAQNNTQKGFETRVLYENYKDSVLNEEKTSAMLKLQVEFDTDQKDKEIAILSKDKALQKSKITQQQTIRNFLIACIVLALLLSALLYNRYRVKLRTNKIIEEKNKELEKLSIVASETANGVFITDAKGDMEWFNEGFSKLFGWKTIEEYRTKKGVNIFDVSANENIVQLIKQCIDTKGSVVYENSTPDKDGNELWIKTTLTPIFDEQGELSKMVFIETDVSELKKAKETAEQSLQIQEQFLANTSHEIRTPMNGVLGMTRQLLETPLNAEQTEYLNAIKESSNNLLHVVNDILDISKIRAGKILFDKSEFRISDLFKSLQFMLQYKAEEKSIILDTHIDPDIAPVLLGDSVRLNQILINLAGNAIKFTEIGHVSFTADLVMQESNYSIVQFCVLDTGIGIPNDKLDFIFETFAQAETHTTRKYGGTGLGLSISKILVEQLGGNIHVTSKVGIGSSFCFKLKFEHGNPEWNGTLTQYTEGIPANVDMSHVNLLLVEDNVINQRVVQFELNKWKVKTDVANNASIAFEKLKNKKYDLILMDISMPGMDGIEATQCIRKDFHDPINKIPIIAMTASALLGEKERCLAAGMNDYISKPFNPVSLYKKVVRWGTNESAQIIIEDKKAIAPKRKRLIDLSIIRDYAGGDVSYIKEMIQIYNESMPGYLSDLTNFYNQKNWEELGKQAHKMKAPAAYFGVEDLKDLLLKIEVITQGDANELVIDELMRKVKVLIDTSINELSHELNKIS